ncbi:hypothetical protein AM10699_64510 (plasmid) [Acaryochloris marina MBIC10699]|nr:hypothetical protein AM10699_64510 [Acaryochloris marina MBIC10699]
MHLKKRNNALLEVTYALLYDFLREIRDCLHGLKNPGKTPLKYPLGVDYSG